ncbi:glycoside hydrolase family 78 protein [Ramaria rubella]|nr:glycoside hydrolase family 78 protein [Ramaria rubella]
MMPRSTLPALLLTLSTTLPHFPCALALAPSGPWDAFNIAPATRTLWPTAVKTTHGSVSDAANLVGRPKERAGAGVTTLSEGSWIALDFGKEVGGLITLSLSPSPNTSLSLAFTESPLFIGPISDDSSFPSANQSYDGALSLPVPLPVGPWTMPAEKLRGGFRYLTVVAGEGGEVKVSNVSVALEFMPHWEDLTAYTGYFYAAGEDVLNKAWYAGPYTVQTNTVPLHTGRQVPFTNSAFGWFNNATLGIAGPIIVDGAKRDRAVWPGDMGIAVPTQFVSTFDLLPTRNALATQFSAINPKTGALPESGPPLSQLGSDTYHAHTIIGVHNYWLYSGDETWVQGLWANYTKAVGYLAGRVDSSGLLDVLGTRDWARLGQGGHNAEANALYYKVLTTATDIANALNQTALAAVWAQNATALKTRYNEVLWDAEAGLYRDNETTTLHPQDANSFAVLYNLTLNAEQAQNVSEGLTKNWNELGPIAPELPDTISPFITGFELQAHFTAGNDETALDLLKRTWGYMLTTNQSVESTLLEGFTANGSIWYRGADGYNFDPAYTSHSHGWSSGATSALTYYVLGLTVTTPQGKTWSVAPHPSGLQSAEGGFETALGWFGVKWSVEEGEMRVDVDVPGETGGVVVMPAAFGARVSVDGRDVEVEEGAGVSVSVSGGQHVVVGRSG